MAKGYPVRNDGPAKPECPNCGSQRMTPRAAGTDARRCLDCGHVVHEPFVVP
jgi:ribosomal protein S27E